MSETTAGGSRLEPPAPGASDHVLGGEAAPITLVEYGSFHCPYCEAAHKVVADLRDRFGDRMRYVFRHRPITGDATARAAAELAEFAHETRGGYWEVHDELMKLGPALEARDCDALSARLGLAPEGPGTAEAWERSRGKVARDMESARRSGAAVSPTFFINNRRYEGPWDESSLAEAIRGSMGHRMQTVALDFARWAPSTGVLLLLVSLIAVAMANSAYGAAFEAFWRLPIGFAGGDGAYRLPLRDWINDGLLTVFFLVVGLEIKREFTVGRLASARAAGMPIAAAIGGMLAPALIYLAVVPAGPLSHGWAVPTTTDTAFAIALIALLGRRVPVELRIFLTAAVVVDDLVAIALVAVFYSGQFDPGYALAAALVTAALALLNSGGVYRPLPYVLLGFVLWGCLHGAGLHATLTGVLLALFTPTRPPANLPALMSQADAVIREEMQVARERVLRHGPSEPALRALDAIHDRIESPAAKLLRTTEPWSSYFVLPVFALANAGLAFSAGMIEGRGALVSAIVLGLVLGKPLGMLLAAAIAVRAGLATKPEAYTWRQLAGAGALAGIGFTMSLYISAKAFPDAADFAAAKAGVFLASVIAGGLGLTLLWREARRS